MDFDSGSGQLIAFQAFQFQAQQWAVCPFNYNSTVAEVTMILLDSLLGLL